MTEPKYLHDHLASNPRRKHGVSSARMVVCSVKPLHGHYPETELCPWCEPPKYVRQDLVMEETLGDCDFGASHYWPEGNHRSAPRTTHG